jgi:hypothetical protein
VLNQSPLNNPLPLGDGDTLMQYIRQITEKVKECIVWVYCVSHTLCISLLRQATLILSEYVTGEKVSSGVAECSIKNTVNILALKNFLAVMHINFFYGTGF